MKTEGTCPNCGFKGLLLVTEDYKATTTRWAIDTYENDIQLTYENEPEILLESILNTERIIIDRRLDCPECRFQWKEDKS